MRTLLTLAALTAASPAFAASGPFFSLGNTNFIVLLAFILFLVVLAYFKIPALLGGMLDKRAEGIRDELDEAKKLREDAQALLASYERKQREVQDQSARIVEHAKEEAKLAAEQARAEMEKSVARRLAAATDQIKSAQDAAVKDVRDSAISVAVAAARTVVSNQMTDKDGDALIASAIKEVDAKLH